MNEQISKELNQLYKETYLTFKKNNGTKNQDYWQGRKDAMRLCLSILRQDDNLRDLLDSSPGYIPVDSELFQDLLEDAVYNVVAILYEIECEERIHPQTRLNLERFVDKYDYLAKKGKFRVIDDHCLAGL